jgi:hypothetical protein
MYIFNPAYNKKRNLFAEGMKMIRNKNNNFFLNAKNEKSIYDLTDIDSYYTVYEIGEKPSIVFRDNSGLPEKIRIDIVTLFEQVWKDI